MKSFSTATIIHASPETIWDILTDASNYSTWNTTIIKIEGTIALGEKIIVYAKVSPNQAFPLTVTDFIPKKRMVWSSGIPLGLFKGERTYTLSQMPDGSVEFAMQEIFSGLMAPLITRSIPDLTPAFDEFAASLKRQSENHI